MLENYLYSTDKEREKHLLSFSITLWSRDDFEFMGYYKRKMLEANGDPIEATCKGKYNKSGHSVNLVEEDKIIYLTCTGCNYTKTLSNHAVKKDVQTCRQRKVEWRF